MANLSEDIQCASFDTLPPMLDRTDFASWKQRIRLYCQGKENGVNILKSIDEGPFQMGTVWETLAEGTDGAPHLGPERPRVYSYLSPKEKDRGLRDSNYDQLYAYLKQHEAHANENKMMLDRFTQHTVDPLALMSNGNNPQGGGAAGYEGAQNRVGNANPGQARQIKYYNCNDIGHIARNYTQPKRPQNFDYFKDKMLLMQAQENGVALDEEQLLFLAGGQDNAIDEDVDEQPAPTRQTMFMANLSSAYPIYNEADPSYDSDILFEIHDHDHYQDVVYEHHEEHEMHDNVQLNYVVDSHADYTSDSNMIMYDQYVKDNAVPGVQIVDNSLTAKLATYKEQVELYERRSRFELTEREQKIDEQLRIVITDRNFKEETLKKELHSVKLQLASTINHNKLMPALYNGHEIIKDNHVSAIVHNTEDTLEIAEITKRKMKDPECVNHKVKIAPHDYSKENFLATFTPQKKLTPEQIFWS
nr:hypothetical protein [Tanacetum cinerariifolium]